MGAFPLRRVFFSGLSLWSFNDPRALLTGYYGAGWEKQCVGHATFHRYERKYRDTDEQAHFSGSVDCEELAAYFAFAGEPVSGLPSGLGETQLLNHLQSYFQRLGLRLAASGGPVWKHDMPTLPQVDLRAPLWPFAPAEWELRSAEGSTLTRSGTDLQILLDLRVEPKEVEGRCDLVLRLLPFNMQGSGTAGDLPDLSSIASQKAHVLETANGEGFLAEVFSCVCRQQLDRLSLYWVYEDSDV